MQRKQWWEWGSYDNIVSLLRINNPYTQNIWQANLSHWVHGSYSCLSLEFTAIDMKRLCLKGKTYFTYFNIYVGWEKAWFPEADDATRSY